MGFHEWLQAKGFALESLTDVQKTALQASWRAEINPQPAPAANTESATRPAQPGASSFNETLKGFEAEADRIRHIEERTKTAMESHIRSQEKLKQIRELCESAIADKNTDPAKFDLALMRISERFTGPLVISGGDANPPTDTVVECALARRAGLDNIDKQYDERTLESADKHFRHGIGLQDLMGLAARRNGWRGASVKSAIESREFWNAAFPERTGMANPYDFRQGIAGPSTYSLPNILSSVANKFLRVGFEAVDSVWSRISARRSVNDFKTATTAALTGSLLYRKLAPSGEIKHGTISETVYTNKADTYAIMLGIARTDLINDDLSALSSAGRRMGRGGALKINDIFWTIFLNNSSFFTSGNSNVSTGGGSALGTADGAAINAAEVKFMNQTDPDGMPLAVMPRILLAPPTLRNTAARWMGSQLFTPSGTAGLGATNIFGGRYTVESSPYMENSAYTGNSTAAWYLLADPNDMPVIEVAFLNGKDTPTVETADADFNQLGIAMRGYLDFGVSLQEYRGGVRSAGS